MNDFWYGLEPSRKFGLIFGLIVIVGVSVALAFWTMRVEYSVLFSNLSDTDAAKIMTELDNQKILYKLSETGSTILVAKDQVYETRLRLTSTGALVKGGAGFELFDSAEYGMTDFAQKINYQRALQGELSRTISSLAKISYARVHLVLPESTLFRKKEAKASAAITVVVEGNEELTEPEIKGIQQLVSASVQDLAEEEIIIVDQRGRTLTKRQSTDAHAADNRLDEKQRLEHYFKEKVAILLDGVFGVGAGIVNVDVTLNYDKVQRRIEKQLPTLDSEGNPLVSRSSITKSTKPSGTSLDSAADQNVRSATNEVKEMEYRFGKSIEEQVVEAGSISRLTISVLVPKDATPDALVELKKLIIAATGFNSARGDIFEISALALDDTDSGVFIAPVPIDTFSPADEERQHDSASVIENSEEGTKSLQLFFSNYWYLVLFGVIATFVLGFLLLKGREKHLSQIERDALLREVKDWLSASEGEGSRVG